VLKDLPAKLRKQVCATPGLEAADQQHAIASSPSELLYLDLACAAAGACCESGKRVSVLGQL